MEKTTIELDQLKELASIAAGNSSNSLSKIFNTKITIHNPQVTIQRLEEVSTYYKYQEKEVTAVVLKINHKLSGIFLMSMSTPDAEIINTTMELKELGNILCGTAINSLSAFLNLDIFASIPAISTGDAKAILNSLLAELGRDSQSVLAFETNLSLSNQVISIYYIFDPQSTDTILDITKRKV